MAENEVVARSPLHHWHVAEGATVAVSDGWAVPSAYRSGVESEKASVSRGLGIADISAWDKVSLLGPGVAALTQALAPNSAALRIRGVATGTIEWPALACRLTEDHLLLLATTTNPAALVQHLQPLIAGKSVILSDATTSRAGFALIGNNAEAWLRRFTSMDVGLNAFPVGSCAETSVAGVAALLVRATELVVPSIRVYVAWDLGEYVWERLCHPAPGLEIAPIGSQAWEWFAGKRRFEPPVVVRLRPVYAYRLLRRYPR